MNGGIFCRISSIPHNIVMDVNNAMEVKVLNIHQNHRCHSVE